MKVKGIGEFNLIEKLTSIIDIKDKDVLVGFGDDCACINVNGKLLLFSSDIQIENVHFIKNKIKPEHLGWKLISVNVSDIVACGGVPKWSLISLSVPEETKLSFLEDIYRGIKKALDFYSLSLIGGNTSKSSELVLDLFIVGETERFVPRSGAKKGDTVFLSGYTGLSKAGLELILMDKKIYEDWEEEIIMYHTKPTARIDIQPLISEFANSCIDVSDGLVGDLSHIEKMSNVKIVIQKENLPVHPLLKRFCDKYGKDPYEYILYGGEDYQLVFTVEKKNEKKIKNAFKIGYVEEGNGIFLKEEKKLIKLKEKGFEHI